jgi:hypothetical protein
MTADPSEARRRAAAEAVVLAADEADRAEMAEVAALMADLLALDRPA